MSQRRTRIEELFDAVVELPDGERSSYLEKHCNDDGVREEVLSLLRYDDASESMLDGSMQPPPRSEPQQLTPDEVIAGYEILEILGQGGMGVVFLAEQTRPIRRRVAVKVIKLGMDTREVIARFETERQILAMLDHPNVAKVLDAGSTGGGRSYFAMEYVPGMAVTDFCDDQRLPISERLALFLDVCGAIQHAHQKGVIHRDVKPSNVLVTTQRVAKVIDFGVAKATGHGLTEKAHFTTTRQLIGTPEYMSPEQAGTPLEVDTRTDVYSLGVLLYELLAGSTPFDATVLREAPYDEICRKIREEDPPTPSTRLSALARSDSTTVAERRRARTSLNVVRDLRGDLDWITMKAMDKDLSRRYASASELAADIRRHLADEPVLAGPPGAGYRLRKFARRNRVGVIATASIAISLLLGLALAIAGFVSANEQRERAELSEQREKAKSGTANTVVDLLQTMFRTADPHKSRGESYTLRRLLDEYTEGLERHLEGQPDVEGTLRATIGVAYLGLGDLDRAETHLRRALELKRGSNATSPGDLAETLRDYGWLLHRRGDHESPELLYREALAIWEETAGPVHAGVADLHFALGDLYGHRNDFTQAEFHYEKSLEILAALGGEDSRIAQCQLYLATLRVAQGRRGEAEQLYRSTLQSMRVVEGVERPWRVANAAFELGTFLRNRGDLVEAEPLLREALSLRLQYYEERHVSVAGAQAGLGKLLLLRGDHAAAEPLLRTALATFQVFLGDDDEANARALNWWGQLRHAQGNYSDAEESYRKALTIARERKLGPILVASICDWLGSLSVDRGKLDEAESLFHEALSLRQKAVRDTGDGVAKSHNNIAVVLARRGDLENAAMEAVASLDSLIELSRKELPQAEQSLNSLLTRVRDSRNADTEADLGTLLLDVARLHQDRALSLALVIGTHASIARRRGEHGDASRFYRAVADTRRVLLGEKHASVAPALSGLGESLLQQRKPADALTVLREAADIDSTAPHTQSAILTQARLARALDATGEKDEAESIYRQAIEDLIGIRGADDEMVGRHHNDLGLMLRARGEIAKAEALFREGLRIARIRYDDDHPSVTTGLNNLAMARKQQKDLVAARDLFEQSLAGRRRFNGNVHASVATTAMNLADVLQSQSDRDGAEALYREAVATFTQVFPKGHPRTAVALSKLAVLCLNRGKLADAEDAFRRGAGLREKLFGAGHPTVILDRNNLGYALLRRGKTAEAEEQLREALTSNTRLRDDHSTIDGVRFNLARALILGGKITDAEPLLRRSLEVRVGKYPAGHRRLRKAHTDLALVLQALARTDEADELFARSGFDAEKSGDDWPFDSALYRWHLGCLLKQQGTLDSAEVFLRSALAAPEFTSSEPSSTGHLDIVGIRCELAEVVSRQGRHEEAETILLAVHEVVRTRHAEDGGLQRVTRAFVDLYERWDKPGMVRKWRDRSGSHR